MTRMRPALLATALLLLAGGTAGPAHAYNTVYGSADCSDSTRVVVQWTFVYDPTAPAPPPEWAGWDVERRTVGDCGTWTRANADLIPHATGITESLTFSEPPPAMHAALQYRLVMVDAQHQAILPAPDQCVDCNPRLYTTCPLFSAPLVHGTVEDMGWAVFVMPCPGTCYTSFYVEGPAGDPLRAYAGTGDAVRLYGTPGCGTVEGCSMLLDHFDVMPCDVVPAVPSTWGRVKMLYR